MDDRPYRDRPVARGNGRDPTWVIRPLDPRIPDLEGAFGVALSPDGTEIAAELREQQVDLIGEPGGGLEVNVYVVGSEGSNLRLVASDAYDPAWSPDGSRIAYVAAKNAVETIAPDGTEKRTLFPPDDAVRRIDRQVKSNLDFSPDGRSLMFRLFKGARPARISRIAIADVATGAVRRLPARVTGFVYHAAWCANGRRIAFSAPPPRLRPSPTKPDACTRSGPTAPENGSRSPPVVVSCQASAGSPGSLSVRPAWTLSPSAECAPFRRAEGSPTAPSLGQRTTVPRQPSCAALADQGSLAPSPASGALSRLARGAALCANRNTLTRRLAAPG